VLDRRYLRGAKDMREFIARILEGVDLHSGARLVRDTDLAVVREAMAQDPAWTRRMLEEDVEHQRAGWRQRTTAYQARNKSRGAVK
jgi:hypothetical protein